MFSTKTKIINMKLNVTIIKFPEISLKTRDAQKLRGFFGNLFREYSEILHNHYADGSVKYSYPLVQYKVIENIPHLAGIEQGGKLLMELFLRIKHLNIEGNKYPVNSKNITNTITEIQDFGKLRTYRFNTLWMGLNQQNYQKYIQMHDTSEKNEFLNRQICNSIMAFYKGIGYTVKDRIMATGNLREKSVRFKDRKMLAFDGSFVTNACLPDYVGIGKAVSRGFGTIIREKS